MGSLKISYPRGNSVFLSNKFLFGKVVVLVNQSLIYIWKMGTYLLLLTCPTHTNPPGSGLGTGSSAPTSI